MSKSRICDATYEALWGGVLRTHYCDQPDGHWPRTRHHCAVCGNTWDIAGWAGGLTVVGGPE